MPKLNKAMMMGHLVRDCEIKQTKNGKGMATGTIAIEGGFGKQKSVCYLDFVLFGNSVTNFERFAFKGYCLYLEGRLSMDTWESNGKKQSKVKMIVDMWQFIKTPHSNQQEACSEEFQEPQQDSEPDMSDSGGADF